MLAAAGPVGDIALGLKELPVGAQASAQKQKKIKQQNEVQFHLQPSIRFPFGANGRSYCMRL